MDGWGSRHPYIDGILAVETYLHHDISIVGSLCQPDYHDVCEYCWGRSNVTSLLQLGSALKLSDEAGTCISQAGPPPP